jgi:hypothetical protein
VASTVKRVIRHSALEKRLVAAPNEPQFAARNMDTPEVITQMRSHAEQIARLVTALHPLTAKLGKPEAQSEILRALFELTKQVEVVKKQLLRVEKQDESKLL